jgi:hypothetical protein
VTVSRVIDNEASDFKKRGDFVNWVTIIIINIIIISV